MTKTRLELRRDGCVAHVFLAAPKANVLDATMISELDTIFESLERRRDLCAIVLEADGPNFSFGASVAEHLPEQIEPALARLGALLRRVTAAPAPVIAAVRGQCLGGGLELVLACDLIVAEENAQLGVPEIRLGVFPPAASALLPARVGAPARYASSYGRAMLEIPNATQEWDPPGSPSPSPFAAELPVSPVLPWPTGCWAASACCIHPAAHRHNR